MRPSVAFFFALPLIGYVHAKGAFPRRYLLEDGKIVSGTDALPGEFPFIVSLYDTNSQRHVCGGAILDPLWIVTAGHCVENRQARILRVDAGELDFSVSEGSEQSVAVRRVTIHPSYDTIYLENDIALLELSEPLVLSDFVQTISLPVQLQAFEGDSVVAGWGDLVEGGTRPTILQKVSLPIIDDATCNAAYADLGGTFGSNICAGYMEGGTDSCDGDSGGPMTCLDGTVQKLCGIVSWGSGCARPGRPGVYTEVSFFTNWIAQVMGV